jgi:pteridine reductase
MNVNLRAAWLCAKEAAIVMQSREDRSLIVNIADSAAYQHWMEYGIYGLSKSALLELTVLLAKTFAPKIRVNSVSPGLILKDENTSAASWDTLIQKTLLQSSGSPNDIIGAIDYLWDNPFITGVDIPVDGGYRWKK